MAKKYGTPVKPTIKNDEEALAEFFMRKVRNHHPLRERSSSPQSAKQTYEGNVMTYTLPDGRQFKVTVEEVKKEADKPKFNVEEEESISGDDEIEA